MHAFSEDISISIRSNLSCFPVLSILRDGLSLASCLFQGEVESLFIACGFSSYKNESFEWLQIWAASLWENAQLPILMEIHAYSIKHFLPNIKAFNAYFQMTSFGVTSINTDEIDYVCSHPRANLSQNWIITTIAINFSKYISSEMKKDKLINDARISMDWLDK